MLRSRIIPVLLMRDRGLVKTKKFGDFTYLGDPINAVKVFNEKCVDELMVLDIDASVHGREPDYEIIEALARGARMPVCYGGGIQSAKQAEKVISFGIEKVAVSSAAISDPSLISNLAKAIGGQSVVAVLDIKKGLTGGYSVYVNNGQKRIKQNWLEIALEFERNGAGEITLNSIDRDGMMAGYDLKIIEELRRNVNVPITAIGGAGKFEDLLDLVERTGVVGAGVGSFFLFRGAYKAFLISYVDETQKQQLANASRLATSKKWSNFSL